MQLEMVDPSKKESLSIDAILNRIGEFGRYQKLVDAAFCLIFLFISFPILIMYFSTLSPTWHCTGNNTLCTSMFNGTQPAENKARCTLPRDTWAYTEGNDYSMVSSFNICDDWILHVLQSIHFIGWGLGATALGWAGDVYGRKSLLFPSCGVVWLCGFATAFIGNVYVILVLRFLVGFFIPGAMVLPIVLISEIVGNKKRPLATQIPFFFIPIGYIMLAVKSYLLANWKYLTIVCTGPYVFLFALYFFVPRSPKWLLGQRRSEEAMQCLRKIARWNKAELLDNVVLSDEAVAKNMSGSEARKGSWTHTLIIQTLAQSFIWFVVSMSIFSLQMAAKELQGSMYTNFILLSSIAFPAVAATVVATNKLGRKKTTIISLFCESAACLSIVFIPASRDFAVARITLGITGKFFACITLQSMYVWSAEIFPTDIRSKGMGVVEIMARFGAACAPWVVKGLTPVGVYLPFVVMGVPAFFGAVIGLWLPETKTLAQGGKQEG